jgi:hypothetical protein
VQRGSDQERAETVSKRAFPWLLLAAVGGGGILAFLGGTGATWHELYDKNLEKLEMIAWTKALIRDHPWLGIGRGAFETVFPAYRGTPGNVVFTHAENFPAQWISEWGMPVGGAAMGAFGWFFRPTTLAVRRSSIMAGGWIGAFVLLLQNLLDLALEVPAVSIALAVTLGSLWGDHKRRRISPAPGRTLTWRETTWPARAALASVGAMLVVALVAAVTTGSHDVGRDKSELYEAVAGLSPKDPAAVPKLRDDLRAAMLRHPAEPYLPLLGAMVAKSTREVNPIPWIQRSLERGNINGYAHVLLADILATNKVKNQALMELRFAVMDDPDLTTITAARAVLLTRDFDDLLRTVPPGRAGLVPLENLAAGMKAAGEAGIAERLEREAMARDPNRPGPHRAIAQVLIDRIGASAARSERTDTLVACEAEVQQHVAVLEKVLPGRSDADDLRARLLLAKGHAEEAERLIASRCESVEDHASCLRTRLAIAAQVPGSRTLAVAAKDALAGGCGSASECADLETWIGDLMTGRGDLGGASAYYARATREEPTEVRWMKLAQVASKLGSHVQAADALQKVAQLRGHADPDLDAQIRDQRSKALGTLDK